MRAGATKLEYNVRESSIILLEYSWVYGSPPFAVMEPIDPTIYEYRLWYRAGTSGGWTSIGAYRSDGSLGYQYSFLGAQQWKYEHESKNLSTMQYYYEIFDIGLSSQVFQSNTLTVPPFAGWGKKGTRISANDSIKKQEKTRLKTPRF
jgi:hypothetical protein